VHTPGHAPDHLCFWHEETRTLFCGDLAVRGTSVWIPSSLQGDLAAYLASLRRVLALQPARLLPAHGPTIEEPEKLLRQYLEHRRQREEQVIEALRSGETEPDAIVRRIYEGLDGNLFHLARESVISHLVKLEREGRARSEGTGWTIEP
jgi:glyoxylase-like metal-dependent hydrolase (beta-lactamase superfamily II)